MHLDDFENQLQRSPDIRRLNQALRNQLSSIGIKTFSFTYYATHPYSREKLQYDFCSENYTRWHQHYVSEGYASIDSTFETIYQSTLPVFWDVHEQLQMAKTARERQMRVDSIAFGAVKGLSVPIHLPRSGLANLLVVQMKGESCLENWHKLQYELLAVAHYYCHYLQQKLLAGQTASKHYGLSSREMQCLLLLARQYSVPHIAKQLSLAERTINFHIQNINKKLGAKNKYQSVATALARHLLIL